MKIIKGNKKLNDALNSWLTWAPILNWSTANPVSPTASGRYKQIGKTVFFNVNITSANGNGATGLSISPPIPPKNNGIKPPVTAHVIVGGTTAIRGAQIRDDGSSSDINFLYMGTATAGQTLSVNISGTYEIQ